MPNVGLRLESQNLRATLATHDAEIQELKSYAEKRYTEQTFKDRNMIEALENDNRTATDKINKLLAEIGGLNTTIANLNKTISDLRGGLSTSEVEIQRLKATVKSETAKADMAIADKRAIEAKAAAAIPVDGQTSFIRPRNQTTMY